MSSSPVIPGLEHAFDVDAQLGPLQDHGMTRVGHRRVIPVAGGTITGSVEAVILAGGADWQTVRADGSIEIDCRYTALTTAGAFLYLQVRGVRSGDPAALEALLRGDQVDPADYYFRTAITIEASDPDLAYLENSVYIASCIREADSVRYSAYRVT